MALALKLLMYTHGHSKGGGARPTGRYIYNCVYCVQTPLAVDLFINYKEQVLGVFLVVAQPLMWLRC